MDTPERATPRAKSSDDLSTPRDPRPPGFADLLRRHRVAAGLTQEELAERATLSAQAIGALERGLRNNPQRETIRLLADALGLAAAERARFTAAARCRTPAAPVAPPTYPGNLPASPTPLIGRAEAVTAAVARLRGPDTRLLTVTGPGGIGKSRLALAIAETLRPDYPDGTFFVPLATVDDPALVVAAIARPLGVVEQGAHPLRATLLDALRERRLLLLLDNFERLLPAVALVEDLLAACRGIAMVVTSRAALRSPGEYAVSLVPLALPQAHSSDLAMIAAAAAVDLFVARGVAVQPDFRLTATNASAVAAICRRLDGLPLAIELAAARLRLLSPAALLGRLDAPFQLLTGGLPGRHGALRDTIDWSHDLLDAEERCLFRRLAVFAGGCAIDDAEAVCAEDGAARAVLDCAEALVAQNLVRHIVGTDGEPRLALFETIREYGQGQLAAMGEEDALRDRHAAYYLALAEGAGLRTGGDATTLNRLEREEGNLCAALAWLLARRDAARGLRLGAALWRFWYLRGRVSEGRHWLAQCAALPDGDAAARGHVSYGLSVFAMVQGEYDEATILGERALAGAHSAEDPWLLAAASNQLGILAKHRGDYATAAARWAASAAQFRALGERRGAALALNNLGLVALNLGDYAGARAAYAESLAMKRAIGDERGIALGLLNLGEALRREGDLAGARAWIEESLARWRALGDRPGLAAAVGTLGQLTLATGDAGAALPLLEESIAAYLEGGNRAKYADILGALADATLRTGDASRAQRLYVEALDLARRGEGRLVVAALEGLAAVALAFGQGARAAGLLGAADTLRARLGTARSVTERDGYARSLAALDRALGAAPAVAALATGQARDPDEIVALALALVPVPGDDHPTS